MRKRWTNVLLVLIFVTLTRLNNASYKTGIGFSPSTDNINCDDFNVLTSPVWYYDWGYPSVISRANCTQQRNIEYIPMIWGWWWQELNNNTFPPETTTILGFNEPNIASQSAIQPADAVTYWKQIQETFPDKILVSPSASPCNGNDCIANFGSQQAWFDEFFRICDGECRVDYLAVHYYYCSPNDLIGSLYNLYIRYNLTIWLTEFNCWDGTKEEQDAFMQEVIPMIESKEWIVKYAWFMARHPDYGQEYMLFTPNTSNAELTQLGETYNTFSLSPTNAPTYEPTEPTNTPTDAPTNSSVEEATNMPTEQPEVPSDNTTTTIPGISGEKRNSLSMLMYITIMLLLCVN